MINSESETKKNLILFVHGFTGGKETWINADEIKRIPYFLKDNKEIFENFDFEYFEYFTKLTDKIEKISFISSYFFGKKRKFKKNISIEDIKDILYTDIVVKFSKYEKIVIIAHSMGGLISKAALLKLIDEDKNLISLFLSLAVPHNGSKLADIAKILFKSNPNVIDLQPLSQLTDKISRDWIANKKIKLLPRTVYYQGKSDNVVPNASSIGYDSRLYEKDYNIVYTNDDHNSILIPNLDSALIISIKDEILGILKKKVNNQSSTNDELQTALQKISNKLELKIPTFEDLIISKDSIPTLSSHISNREETIKDLLSSCEKNWLAIYGMYDTGKTQLVLLLIRFLKFENIWISCSDIKPHFFIQKILRTFDAKDEIELHLKIIELKSEKKKLIILDDLFEFGSNDKVDNFFNGFIKICFENNISIISTSNYRIHSSINTVHFESICEKEILLLNELETLEIVDSYENSKDFDFKNLIYTIAKGYPIYTQVICRYLDSNKWVIEENKLLSFFSGNLFTDLTNETVKKLIEKIQDDNTRELLYRLNIVSTRISENEIKIVAASSPNISRPQEKINSIKGTWIQQINFNEFILSPLIKRLGTKDLSESTILEINYKLGRSIFDKGKVNQIDVLHIITYYISAKKFEDAGFILMSFLQHINTDFKYFFTWNFDLLWYKTILPKEMSLQLRLYIRSQHLLIESHNQPAEENQKKFLRNDLESLVHDSIQNKIDVYFPSLILSYSYLKEDGQKALKYFTYYLNSYTYNNMPKELSDTISDNFDKDDDLIIWLLLIDIYDLNTLHEWFANFEKLSIPIENFDKEQVDLLSDRLYSNFVKAEEKKELQDWEELLKTLVIIFEKSHQLNLEIFKAYSIRNQILILSEKLNDIGRAESLYKDYKQYFTDEIAHYLIVDELGRQFFYKGNNPKALEYLSSIEEIELESYNTTQIDTFLTLSIIYGENDSKKAVEFSQRVYYSAKNNLYVSELWYLKIVGEYAISLYLDKQINAALIILSEGYEKLLNTFEDDNSYKNIQLRYGNIISYIYQHFHANKKLDKSDTHTEPYRGFFKNSNDISELYFDEKLVIIIANFIWFYEEIHDKERACYWADLVFSLQKKIKITQFKMIFSSLIGYKIIKDEYDDAVHQQIEIYENNVVQSKKEEIEELQKYVNGSSLSFTVNLLAFNAIYIRLLYRVIKDEIKIDEANLIFKDLFTKFKQILNNDILIKNVFEIIDNFPSNLAESKNLIAKISILDVNELNDVHFLGYMACSITIPAKQAIECHFAIKDLFPVFSGSVMLYIMAPFFIEYWKMKIDEKPDIFHNLKKLRDNINKVDRLKNQFQIKAIFALVAESLNYTLLQEDTSWLQDYYDEYI